MSHPRLPAARARNNWRESLKLGHNSNLISFINELIHQACRPCATGSRRRFDTGDQLQDGVFRFPRLVALHPQPLDGHERLGEPAAREARRLLPCPGSSFSPRPLIAMGTQVVKLLVPHGHELLEVAQIGPLCQAGRAHTCRLETLQPRFRDAVLSDQLDAIV